MIFISVPRSSTTYRPAKGMPRRSGWRIAHRSNALTKRTTGKFKMRSEASLNRELRQLRLRVIAMEHRTKRLIGDAAFAAFEDDVANLIEQDADTSNVVRLRRRVR